MSGRVLAWIWLTAFLAIVPIGFAQDLFSGLRWPLWWALFQGMFYGVAMAVVLIGFAIRKRNMVLAFVALYAAVSLMLPRIGARLPSDTTLMGPQFAGVRSRLALDGMLSSIGAIVGYAGLFLFAGTQGVRHVRERTELELAEKLQQTLAPSLAIRNTNYEIHGRSIPSSQMGGDLLDATVHGEALACYVGDVAGHGIQAGVFMGMIKSSARTALLKPGRLEQLLVDLNNVLFGVKAGLSTYATFACIRCREDRKVEYSLAGHLPILHYHARSKVVSQLAMEQFPLGLFADVAFESSVVDVKPGDVLIILTDGLPEVTNLKEEQFGLERIGEIVASSAELSLSDLTDTFFNAVHQYGEQHDDETLVLVRAL
jgi:hypothetical protein